MQKPNHTSARVSNDTSSLTCVSDDISNPVRVSDNTNGPIWLWHVSPIRLCHVSLTHPQTPINRSLPKAFQKHWRRFGRGELEEIKIEKSKSSIGTKLWSLQELQLRIQRSLKRNHPNHLLRSQRSLESSSKASRNLNKPQIGETLQIRASKAPKNFHHKPLNTKNIQNIIIQTTCLDLKVHWNQA